MSSTDLPDRNRLATRLAAILHKLNRGEPITTKALADELKTDVRTIQRDLNERFAFLKLQKIDGVYTLPPTTLGRLSTKDIERFAALAGVKGLFASLDDSFLAELVDSRSQATWLIKGVDYEQFTGNHAVNFKLLVDAIRQHQCISFHYEKTDGLKIYEDIQPYKLVNHDGLWYLAAIDKGQLKAFSFIKISRLDPGSESFTPIASIEQQLKDEDSIWLKEKKQEVVLKVTGLAADHFRRRKLVPRQCIEKELEGGDLIVSSWIAHADQILPTVRQWIPCIRIISPEVLQLDLEQSLHRYLQR